MSRKIARERAFKMLFAIDIGENTMEEAAEIVISNSNDQSQKSFILEEVKGSLDSILEIDELINKHSNEWTVERMAATDRNILRLSVYEILYRKDIPISVSINEAVEIAKKYCDERSYKFINGLLGAIAKDNSIRV
ncbi:MAG: transcription antitermination factor NusB [Tepidanaerobacteraceae bacterium]|nr:transcription antitermination factor NusB [Tepidanaerobacteraceae bacterium]